MLVVIGGRHSSCIVPGEGAVRPALLPKDAGAGVVVIDGGSKSFDAFMSGLGFQDGGCYVIEHAYFAFDGRRWQDKVQRARCVAVEAAKRSCDIFLLTREVSMLDKHLRDIADVRFDFSHGP